MIIKNVPPIKSISHVNMGKTFMGNAQSTETRYQILPNPYQLKSLFLEAL